jgi:hypothetical protein
LLVFLFHDVFPFLFMVNTPGRSINEKNRRASGGLFLFPFSWAHLPSMDQATVASIYLGSVGGPETYLRALLMLVEFTK